MSLTKETHESVAELQRSIDEYIGRLSEGHRMHRKIKFLLDIRGLLVLSKIDGDYVEFGTYRGEMMYAAARILSPHVRRYVGLDTFAGLPVPQNVDGDTYVFGAEGAMASPRETVEQIMSGFDVDLIAGDFRRAEIREQFRSAVSAISVLSVDCNWPSSVEAALAMSGPCLQAGSIVYLDDYFVGTRKKNFNNPILSAVSRNEGIDFVEFMTYPPFGRAFLVEKE